MFVLAKPIFGLGNAGAKVGDVIGHSLFKSGSINHERVTNAGLAAGTVAGCALVLGLASVAPTYPLACLAKNAIFNQSARFHSQPEKFLAHKTPANHPASAPKLIPTKYPHLSLVVA